MEENIKKIISIGINGHRYYVQEVPGYSNLVREYAAMKDRKRLHLERFFDQKNAVLWLLNYLSMEISAPELDLSEF